MRAAPPVAAVLVVALAAGCAEAPEWDTAEVLDVLAEPTTTTTAAASATSTTTSHNKAECSSHYLATASLRPDGGEGELAGAVTEIRERGFLRVGVDENTLGFAFRDTSSGDFEGFEIELAKEIASRIFGDKADRRVRFVPVVTGEKIAFVEDGSVDMTISANSMNCDRWERVAFSSEYYTADQQFLVRKDSELDTVAELAGARVCVTTNSSSLDLLETHVPDAVPVESSDRTGCLVAMQEGEVDAYFGHDSFLYGMKKQDLTVEIRDLLPPQWTMSHYGIAISHEHPDLVRFVNAVLEELRTSGRWGALHHRLEDEIGVPPADPPTARYRD
jgi:polar amino acid transport system substrate-binding protein